MESTDWIERGYRDRARPGSVGRIRQIRHTVAMMFVPSTLRGRLLLLVAVVIATVIGGTEYLESRAFERAATQELLQSAQSTALVVADDLEVRRTALDPAALADRLREFGEAVPAVRAISILTLVEGQPKVLASTASDVSPEAMEAGRRAVESRATTWVGSGVIRPWPRRSDRRRARPTARSSCRSRWRWSHRSASSRGPSRSGSCRASSCC
jgi:hypothetical protein